MHIVLAVWAQFTLKMFAASENGEKILKLYI